MFFSLFCRGCAARRSRLHGHYGRRGHQRSQEHCRRQRQDPLRGNAPQTVDGRVARTCLRHRQALFYTICHRNHTLHDIRVPQVVADD